MIFTTLALQQTARSYRLMWVAVIVSVSTKAAANADQLLVLPDQLKSFYDTENPWSILSVSPDSSITMPQTPPEHTVVSAELTKTAHLSSRNLKCLETDPKSTSLSLSFLCFVYLCHNDSFLPPIYFANHLCPLIKVVNLVLILSEFIQKDIFFITSHIKIRRTQNNKAQSQAHKKSKNNA